ncbi:related to F-box domain protein [Phialocephala subalpina]|uniref:Related to F-box domain protein n=1 Tax=Phialocephala subalpina TaxID=576137 RepID=A0A1L7WCK0_9HELO|nr:related to F-box domain protein [Phialocephala subalpina]
MDITAFPNDIFLLIVAYLSPKELILCRSVNQRFYDAFTEDDLNRHVLLQHFPRTRELRRIKRDIDWAQIFTTVAGRYHYLKAGKPRSISKLAIGRSFVLPAWARFFPVAPWQRHLQFEEKTAPFHYQDPLWTYEDDILIFPSAERKRYVLYNLEAGTFSEVGFESEGKIVRRIRLCERVFVVEWCEQDAYHKLNENEMVYRHFATAYDVSQDSNGQWWTVFRNEWKIHFLGFPLNSKDRFFSTHNKTHYVIYLWQPNRSAWGEDEPIEALAVWDISSRSEYRPSEDPTGKGKPEGRGPHVLRRFSFADLDFYRIRQRSTPVLRSLELDENHVYVLEEDHRWLVGQQASHTLPRLHMVKTIGIPFSAGPCWQDECGADGDVDLSFCERVSDIRQPYIAPCWRHEEFPYLTISEAVDAGAGVIFSARHCFMLETISINVKPRVRMSGPGYEISLRDDLWVQLMAKGKICGDERWLIGENSEQEVVILHFDEDRRATASA